MKNPQKIALLDFDGTLVRKDILDVLCGLVGKEQESQKINEAFHRGESSGLQALVSRISLLAGITQSQIQATLEAENYLLPGVHELVDFFKKHHVQTILASGNIVPVLSFYQQLLGIDYVVGSKPNMDGEKILGIDESSFSSTNFKGDGIRQILRTMSVEKENVVAIGDSPADADMFRLSGYAIAINPKGTIADVASAVIYDDLREALPLIKTFWGV